MAGYWLSLLLSSNIMGATTCQDLTINHLWERILLSLLQRPCDVRVSLQKRQKYNLKVGVQPLMLFGLKCDSVPASGLREQDRTACRSMWNTIIPPSAPGQQLLQHKNSPLLSILVISVLKHCHITVRLAFVSHLLFSKQWLDASYIIRTHEQRKPWNKNAWMVLWLSVAPQKQTIPWLNTHLEGVDTRKAAMTSIAGGCS